MDITCAKAQSRIHFSRCSQRPEVIFLALQLRGPSRSTFYQFVCCSSKLQNSDFICLFISVRYWPEWLPGGGFHSTAKIWSKQLHDTVDAGLQFVKNTMVIIIFNNHFFRSNSHRLYRSPEQQNLRSCRPYWKRRATMII
jgi:hypothetical protein